MGALRLPGGGWQPAPVLPPPPRAATCSVNSEHPQPLSVTQYGKHRKSPFLKMGFFPFPNTQGSQEPQEFVSAMCVT